MVFLPSQVEKMADEKNRDAEGPPSSPTKRMIKLPSEFFSTAHLKQAKPTFTQKQKLAELQALAFLQVKTADYVPGLTRLIQLTADVVECEDFSNSLKPNMSHPWFWRAIGFYSEEPMVNFSYYHEPMGGRGEGSVLGAEGTRESNKRQSNNGYVEMPLNPLTSRFGGGLLTLQCILYFFEAPRYSAAARGILRKRRQDKVYSSTEHYLFIVVAMEIVRIICLTFHLLQSREQETPKYPVQPDTRCMVPFEVDWQNTEKLKIYPMRSFWHMLCQPDGFERLFCCTFLLYDTIYDDLGCDMAATYTVVQHTDTLLQDILNKCGTLEAIEEMVAVLRSNDVRGDT